VKKSGAWSRFLLILIAFAVVATIFLGFSELEKIVNLIKSANPFYLLLALLTQLFVYVFKAKVYQTALSLFGKKESVKSVLNTVLVALFINRVFPSLGMSDNAYLITDFKKRGLPIGQAALISVIEVLSSFVVFSVLLFGSAIFLSFTENLQKWQAGLLVLTLTAVTVFWFVLFFILLRKAILEKVVRQILKISSFVFKHKIPTDGVTQNIEDVANGRGVVWQKKEKFLVMCFWQLLMPLFDSFTIFLIFASIGVSVGYQVVLVALVFAVFLNTISLIPGGIGSFEAAMILTLNSLKVPFEVAVTVTLMFRLFNYWMTIPLGFWFYRKKHL